MVKSADRTLEILETLADTPHRPGLTELAHQLGIPKSSLHAILRTFHFRSGDHLQRTRDLTRVLDGFDSPL